MSLIFDENVGFCPWHQADSSFDLVHGLKYASPEFGLASYDRGLESRNPERTGVFIYECLHCQKSVVILERKWEVKEDGKDYRTRLMIAPEEAPRELHASAPGGVRSLFAEASTCEQVGALRAAGVMYRAAVEELVADQGAPAGKLWQRIESLKGTLPGELVRDFHEARMLGNDSIHEGIVYSAEEVADVAHLIEEAVLVLYVQPAEKQAMRDARKARRAGASSVPPRTAAVEVRDSPPEPPQILGI